MNKRYLLVIFPTLLVGIALGFVLDREKIVVREGTPDTPAAMSSVNLMVDDGEGRIATWNTVTWNEAMSVTGLLEKVAGVSALTLIKAGEEKDTIILAIDGKENTQERRWQYWVNNIYEPTGAGKYFLKPGDIVMWKYAAEQSQ